MTYGAGHLIEESAVLYPINLWLGADRAVSPQCLRSGRDPPHPGGWATGDGEGSICAVEAWKDEEGRA
jgi:hypothetical protein